MLESRPWFVKGTSAELMFVVQELQDASNYKWWSRGGTVTLGKSHSFKIEVVHQDGAEGDETTEEKPGEDAGENVESPFVIENGILTGIKDPSLTQVVLPAEVKIIASGAFCLGRINPSSPCSRAHIAIGSAPLIGCKLPSNPSSPIIR